MRFICKLFSTQFLASLTAPRPPHLVGDTPDDHIELYLNETQQKKQIFVSNTMGNMQSIFSFTCGKKTKISITKNHIFFYWVL